MLKTRCSRWSKHETRTLPRSQRQANRFIRHDNTMSRPLDTHRRHGGGIPLADDLVGTSNSVTSWPSLAPGYQWRNSTTSRARGKVEYFQVSENWRSGVRVNNVLCSYCRQLAVWRCGGTSKAEFGSEMELCRQPLCGSCVALDKGTVRCREHVLKLKD